MIDGSARFSSSSATIPDQFELLAAISGVMRLRPPLWFSSRSCSAGERPYTLPGESHRQPKAKPVATKPRTELLSQRRWREEKPLRAAAFDEKQAKEHAEAVARKERARLDVARAAEVEASKNLEAALHVVPPKPTLSLA